MVRKKKQIKLKEPVRLRKKKLKDGNRSLYLDIYSNGIRKYEYLIWPDYPTKEDFLFNEDEY